MQDFALRRVAVDMARACSTRSKPGKLRAPKPSWPRRIIASRRWSMGSTSRRQAAAGSKAQTRSLILGEGIQVLIGPDIQDILRDRRSGRHSLPELQVLGNHLRFGG